jgi:hypothetical protein
MNEVPPLTPVNFNYQPYFLAVVIDNTVYDIMNLDLFGAQKFLAQPTFVQVDQTTTVVGATYDPATGVFTPPTPTTPAE